MHGNVTRAMAPTRDAEYPDGSDRWSEPRAVGDLQSRTGLGSFVGYMIARRVEVTPSFQPRVWNG